MTFIPPLCILLPGLSPAAAINEILILRGLSSASVWGDRESISSEKEYVMSGGGPLVPWAQKLLSCASAGKGVGLLSQN